MGFFFLPYSFISWFKSFSHFCLFVAPWGAFTPHGSLKRFMKVIISDWRRISTYNTHTGATHPNTSSRVALIFRRPSLWRVHLWKHLIQHCLMWPVQLLLKLLKDVNAESKHESRSQARRNAAGSRSYRRIDPGSTLPNTKRICWTWSEFSQDEFIQTQHGNHFVLLTCNTPIFQQPGTVKAHLCSTLDLQTKTDAACSPKVYGYGSRDHRARRRRF